MLAVVPDLISMVDIESYEPILTEDLKYGLRVCVILIPCDDYLRSEACLKYISPANFGYPKHKYVPFGKKHSIESVLKKF